MVRLKNEDGGDPHTILYTAVIDCTKPRSVLGPRWLQSVAR